MLLGLGHIHIDMHALANPLLMTPGLLLRAIHHLSVLTLRGLDRRAVVAAEHAVYGPIHREILVHPLLHILMLLPLPLDHGCDLRLVNVSLAH